MKKTIVVVEDNPDIRQLIAMTLDVGDFEVHEAENGAEGLRLAASMRPDLMLLDVMMPGEFDGYQVCERIKRDPDLSSIIVVMLTARGQQSDREAGCEAGCDAYLTKPFSPMALVEAVESLLDRKRKPGIAD